MAGILANSSAVTMGVPDALPTNAVVGFVTTQQVTLSVTPSGAVYQWGISFPSGSSQARAGLSSNNSASPRFAPDAEGEYVVTCLVDGATLYVLRLSVAAAIAATATGGFRMLSHGDGTVQAPTTGAVLYNSTDEGYLSTKGPDGIVRVLADRAWVAQAIAGVLLNAPTLSVATDASAGDDVAVTATVNDADGHATTGVQLYDGGTLLGSMTSTGGSGWAFTIADAASGVYPLRARRVTTIGYQDSAVHTLTVSSGVDTLGTGGDQLTDSSGNVLNDA